jgi:hypothetical protein
MTWVPILHVVPHKEWVFQWHLVVHIQDSLLQVISTLEKCQAELSELVKMFMEIKLSE